MNDFQLIETILWTAEKGYFLLSRHMSRLFASAEHFGFSADRAVVLGKLEAMDESLEMGVDHKVRLLMSRAGSVDMSAEPVAPADPEARPAVTLSDRAVDSSDEFLYHKTTNRELYVKALALYGARNFYDALFINERGELTEGCWNNVIVEINGVLLTPPVSCGLLPGVYRSWLLEENRAAERLLTPADLDAASRVYLCNSVRGMVQVRFQRD